MYSLASNSTSLKLVFSGESGNSLNYGKHSFLAILPADQVLKQSSLFNNSASHTYSVQTSSSNPVNSLTLESISNQGISNIASSTVQATSVQIISDTNFTMRQYLSPFGYGVYANGSGNLTINIP